MNGSKQASYRPRMDYLETINAVDKLKRFFADKLSSKLNLSLACSPLFLGVETGLNDDLNGVERPVEFDTKCGKTMTVAQSLAKWKRHTLGRFGFKPNTGIYTNMNAIRRDEELSNIHSYYVDQWDWEMVIQQSDRTHSKLVEVVETIYSCLVELDKYMAATYPGVIRAKLPPKIHFISAQQLVDKYPGKSALERETLITREYGAVFVTQIGKTLSTGEKHDSRAPDYDDWELNGDILVFNEVIDRAFELSSMGIRVDKRTMLKQLEETGSQDRLKYPYHKQIVNEQLPYTIGGGIGQSRVAMFFLEKCHINEVQASVWTDEIMQQCAAMGITPM